MFGTSRAQRQLKVAQKLFSHVAELLNTKVSVRLWDGSVIPLGTDVEPGLEISIAGPGVLGAMLRKPTPDNLLRHYARKQIDYHGAGSGHADRNGSCQKLAEEVAQDQKDAAGSSRTRLYHSPVRRCQCRALLRR